jgi:fused signal recognition particle receptor
VFRFHKPKQSELEAELPAEQLPDGTSADGTPAEATPPAAPAIAWETPAEQVVGSFAPPPAGPAPVARPSAAAPLPAAPALEPELDDTPGDLAEGLQKTRGGFMSRLRGILKSGPAAADWESVEELLIAGDVGGGLALDVVERARARKDAVSAESAVRDELAALLIPSDPHWRPAPAGAGQPAVLLMVGVNGTGKTTTIGKLAHRYRAEGSSVLLAAADTFRAAAIDQLKIWSDRSGCQFVAHAPGADPAAVIFDALDAAVARGVDIVIADTAGRLHTKSSLMDELAKMRRVIDRRLPGAAPEVLFVLDATTGQNGLAQAKVFHEAVGLTGIVLTKLDSTAKGGIVFAIEDALHVPVRFVGVGEKLGDLIPFDPAAFVDALFA